MQGRTGPGRRWSLARQLFTLQALLLTVVLVAVAVAAVAVGNRRASDDARSRVLGIADTVAANPLVTRAVATSDPTAQLQPYAEGVRRSTGVDFVVIMSPTGTRFTHPDPALIGRTFRGSIAAARAGREFTETYTGSLGPSVRAVTPVRSPGRGGREGRVVALVAVGITTEAIRDRAVRQLPYVLGALVILLAVALAGAALVGRRLRRQTGGVDAETMSGMLATHSAVLESLHEGLLVSDDDGRVTFANDEAGRLLGLSDPAAVRGRAIADLPLPEPLRAVLTDRRPVRGELYLTGDRVLVVDRGPARWRDRTLGTVVTLRDRTELESLTGELDANRSLAQSLHAQTHESANRLHTMIVLMETGRTEEAVAFGTEQLAVSQRLTDRTMAAVDEPVLAALLLGKVAAGAERGIDVDVEIDGSPPWDAFGTADLTTVVGNLLDNALDASAETRGSAARRGRVLLRAGVDAAGPELVVEVSDDGPGLPPETVDRAFTRGWSTKLAATEAGRGLGLALVNQVVRRLGGEVVVETSEFGGARLVVRLPIVPGGGPA